MNTKGSSEIPSYFIFRYKGYSVGLSERYPSYIRLLKGVPLCIGNILLQKSPANVVRTQAWKNTCNSFSAIRDTRGKIEVLVNEKNWGCRSGPRAKFRFGDQDAMMGLEMLDELDEYISTNGEWPDWNGPKEIEGKEYVKSLQKFDGYIKMEGVINQMVFKFQFGIEKAKGFYCAAVDIENLLDL